MKVVTERSRSSLTLHVIGTPRPQNTGKIVRAGAFAKIKTDKSTEEWKALVRAELSRAMKESGQHVMQGPIEARMIFQFERPQSHFNKHGIRAMAPSKQSTKPDVDRIATAVLDAIKGVLICDDSEVSDLYVSKRYVKITGQPPSLTLHVEEVEP